ncbi:MAG: P-loop NTPase [Dongiaceae bacterium]
MTIDLIKRAAERMARERMSAAFELPAEPVATPRGPGSGPGLGFGTRSGAGREEEGWFGRERVDFPAPGTGRPDAFGRAVRRIALDRARLSAAGILTPDAEATRLVEELRILKRPIVRTAMTAGEEPLKAANLVMVTSAKPGEGKSFLAANLAMSVAAEKNLRALLIDTDIQHPDLSRLFGAEREPGLIDFLADPGLELADIVLQTEFENLALIPAGAARDHAPELLASRRMSVLAETLAADAPCITIFDAAPLLTCSEPAVLAFHVGQAVLLVEAERTGRRAVEEALTHLRPCPHVGVVLNKSPAWPGSDRFGLYGRDGQPKAMGE